VSFWRICAKRVVSEANTFSLQGFGFVAFGIYFGQDLHLEIEASGLKRALAAADDS